MERDHHSSRNMNSHKRPIVFAVRDFPPGRGTPSNLPEKPLKNPRTSPKPKGSDLVSNKSQSLILKENESVWNMILHLERECLIR
ncbi:unnamed protein product [Arabis nemorensis]|uniref:Uncharacterized protein n=1 Tax=Arabis nemorensis TaxID=586526 RepID=A0A565C3M4_9BRAS|nr:unnamed protein product [Arabis nemorensis]